MKQCLLFTLAYILYTGIHPLQKSKLITTDAVNTFIPGGTAIDRRTDTKKGRHSDFIKPGEHVFPEGLGMKTDTR